MRFLLAFTALILTTFTLQAQPTEDKLAAYFSFDNCTVTDDTGNGSNGVPLGGVLGCDCGANDNTIEFKDSDSRVALLGIINEYISTVDFSISFFFKPTDLFNTQTILSKRELCDFEHAFEITYEPIQNKVECHFTENASKISTVSATLEQTCWHHITLTRAGNITYLYINGVLRAEKKTNSRVNLTNDAVLTLAGSPCVGATTSRFKGFLDELRIYSKALEREEVEQLYQPYSPNVIMGNNIIRVDSGETVQMSVGNLCTNDVLWSPATGVSDVNLLEPSITPTETTTYTFETFDKEGCISMDTVLIIVTKTDCQEIFMPSAFTPNGDNINDVYSISNGSALRERTDTKLISLEVFDRWGGRVYYSTDYREDWDGTGLGGNALNPGLYLYRLRYLCHGAEEVKTGTISMIR